MQTFLPYSNFEKCAYVLDRKRLGKQRVECLQILQTIFDNRKSWANHPAVNMWRGHEFYLFAYMKKICERWISYGYKDSCLKKAKELVTKNRAKYLSSSKNYPSWLCGEKIFESHKSNLLRKNPEHYSKFFGDISSSIPYFWPCEN